MFCVVWVQAAARQHLVRLSRVASPTGFALQRLAHYMSLALAERFEGVDATSQTLFTHNLPAVLSTYTVSPHFWFRKGKRKERSECEFLRFLMGPCLHYIFLSDAALSVCTIWPPLPSPGGTLHLAPISGCPFQGPPVPAAPRR